MRKKPFWPLLAFSYFWYCPAGIVRANARGNGDEMGIIQLGHKITYINFTHLIPVAQPETGDNCRLGRCIPTGICHGWHNWSILTHK
jgi:hypothetical protein